MEGVSLTSYKLMPPHYFAYVPDTSRRGDKISLALNTTAETFLVSSISVVFSVSRSDILLTDYLFMYFNRPEFDRYARFNSWGSARETFDWSEMCDIDIELPPIEIQQKYVDIYNAMLANQRDYENGLEDLKLACFAMADHSSISKGRCLLVNCLRRLMCVIVRECAIALKESISQNSLCPPWQAVQTC